ncbi:uncharacterized protein [Rutidosis leptorrhynchoides]|uniref:uncharacterized protein n=1 Tax=Rutidosis leptorrhynchoides TaxID=125765 RepID=UPI003A9A3E86
MVRSRSSAWNGIRKSDRCIDELQIQFSNSFVKTVNAEDSSRFWKDVWLGDRSFQYRFPRLFRLEVNAEVLVMDRLIRTSGSNDWVPNWAWSRTPSRRTEAEFIDLQKLIEDFKYSDAAKDGWQWNLNPSGSFYTFVLSSLINQKLLPVTPASNPTVRNNMVPQKLAIFIWRAKLNRLPVLSELYKRGIDLDPLLCPFCNNEVETLKHALCDCAIAKDVWSRVSRWWNTNYINFPCLSDRFTGSIPSNGLTSTSKLWQAVEWVTGYCLWVHRNNVIFRKKKSTGPMLLNNIQLKSFEWISKRSRKHSLIWSQWLLNPKSFDLQG